MRRDGTIVCWGANDHGQLAPSTPPTGLANRVSTADLDYTCALKIDGAIQCWGKDDFGYMADAVLTNGPYVQVSAGPEYTCGIKADGSLACWRTFSRGSTTQTPPGGAFAQISTGGRLRLRGEERRDSRLLVGLVSVAIGAAGPAHLRRIPSGQCGWQSHLRIEDRRQHRLLGGQ